MNRILKDQKYQQQLNEKGYVIIPGFLNAENLDSLIQYQRSLAEQQGEEGAFKVSLFNKIPGFAGKVRDEMKKLATPSIETYFEDYQIFTASYVVKEPNPKAIIPPHQDWTFVDESRFASYTCWIPLQDVNTENGTLGVIPGSHRFLDEPRCSPSPQAQSPIGKYLSVIFPYIQLKDLQAGDALIFDNRTIHASPPNTTDQARIVAGVGLTHKDATFFHHYLAPGTDKKKMLKYQVDEDFFVNYDNDQLGEMYDAGKKITDYPELESVDRKAVPLTEAEFVAMVERVEGNKVDAELMEKVAGLFQAWKGKNIGNPEQGQNGAANQNSANSQAPAIKLPWYKVYTPGNIFKEIDYRIRKSLGIWKTEG